jgi:Na+-translocating ferredoxin:NAD+ oxidoreductase RnfD subunit
MATSVAARPPHKPIFLIRGFPYPVLLPTLRDPRLHLAAVIISLQVLGQTSFDFSVSIAQILMTVATCAVLETAIAFRQQRVIMWPASALLTGNGVAFVLRVPGTQHGDWWSTRGWWIFVGTAAISLLSKYVIKWRGDHIFNPSNFGLVLCFLILGSSRADPLDFWWGPMTLWMALASGIIVAGGLAILLRLKLIGIAIGFWLAFVAGIGVIALSGHAMTARWHLGPVTGRYFWWVLITSPEILVFLFFMITDPKTIPRGRVARIVYGVAIGVLATLLIAPQQTEFGAKVAVLGALAIVCVARPLLDWLLPAAGSPDDRLWAWIRRAASRGRAGVPKLAVAAVVSAAAFGGLLVAAGLPARPVTFMPPLGGTGELPQITILHSTGVQTQLDRKTARLVARSLVSDLQSETRALRRRDSGLVAFQKRVCCDEVTAVQKLIAATTGAPITVPTYRLDRVRMKLRPAEGQGEPIVVAEVTGRVQLSVYAGVPPKLQRREKPKRFHATFELDIGPIGYELRTVKGLTAALAPQGQLIAKTFDGVHLQDVASHVGLNFQQDGFHFTTTVSDVHSMMGGGLCWIDYNDDGWPDLFVVNSYSDGDRATWSKHGGLPTSALFENEHGHFVDVAKQAHLNIPMQGNGCAPIDLGNGYPSLFVTTNDYNVLLRNNGNGTFTNITHRAGIDAFGTFGWHTGAAVADVNGDGLEDIFVSGYADVNAQSQSSGGFPLNYQAFPDLLYLNEGNGRFKDVAAKAGIDKAGKDHSLGAVFFSANFDNRPDLYVANDLDPNRLYMNVKGGPLGFHFVEEGRQWGVDDRSAGMGVAAQDSSGDSQSDLFVTNSRGQGDAAYTSLGEKFDDVRSTFSRALGPNQTGWGDAWVDLANTGRLDLVIANGDIPVADLKKDAGRIQVVEDLGAGVYADGSKAAGLDPGPIVNGRGLAVADYDNDGRMDVAINSIGGKLILLHNTRTAGHWLEIRLKHFVPGASAVVNLSDGPPLTRWFQAGSSYLSSNDPRLHFGLGNVAKIGEVDVYGPHGGLIKRLRNVRADQILTVP